MTRSRPGGVVLLDGPAAGTYSVRRAPRLLRAVVNENGITDLLDGLADTPLPTERVHVYEAQAGSHP